MNNLHWFWVPVIGFLIGRFWYDSLKARELASRIAMTACRNEGLQFLDGTVALERLRLSRNRPGRLFGLVRVYTFAYSDDGMRRYQGVLAVGANQADWLKWDEGAAAP